MADKYKTFFDFTTNESSKLKLPKIKSEETPKQKAQKFAAEKFKAPKIQIKLEE